MLLSSVVARHAIWLEWYSTKQLCRICFVYYLLTDFVSLVEIEYLILSFWISNHPMISLFIYFSPSFFVLHCADWEWLMRHEINPQWQVVKYFAVKFNTNARSDSIFMWMRMIDLLEVFCPLCVSLPLDGFFQLISSKYTEIELNV